MTPRAIARRVLSPWTLIVIGVFALITLSVGAVRYTLAIPPGSIAAYSEPGVYVAQTPAPTWPDWLFRLAQDDMTNGSASRLRLFENSRALGPPHTAVIEISAHGQGRFAHWENAIYFSASDNSDPRTNGHRYLARSPLMPQWPAWAISWGLVAIGVFWLLNAERRKMLLSRTHLLISHLRPLSRPALYSSAIAAASVWTWIALIGVHQITPISAIVHQSGYAYRAAVAPPHGIASWLIRRSDDGAGATRPTTVLLENGEPVGFPRAVLSTVEQMGEGRYVYRSGLIYFSTRDNSDPRSNGRNYVVRVKLAVPDWFRSISMVLLLCASLTAAWQFRSQTRWIAGTFATLAGIGVLLSAATWLNFVSVDEFVPRARLSPSTATAFVADHREIIAPFIVVAPPGAGPAYLIADGEAVLCGRSLVDDSAAGVRCARRENGSQIDFVPPAGVDPRVNANPYAVRLPIRAHPYLIGMLLLACASLAAIAIYRPHTRFVIAGASAFVVTIGLTLTGANVVGLFLPLRNPEIASLAHTFGPDDLTITYDQALAELEPRAGESPAIYAERATFALSAAIVHASPATQLDKWRMHVPIWENWALHLLGLTDARVRRYIFWDPRKHLERGIALCGDLSAVLVAFLEENHINARVVSITGHVVATAEIEPGVWQMYDPDYGLVIPYSLAQVQANPTIVQTVYSRWAAERPELHDYTRDYAERVIPSFFASSEDNSIDPRQSYYSGYATTVEAYIAREALLYRIKWVVPFVLIFIGLGVALLAWPRRRPAN